MSDSELERTRKGRDNAIKAASIVARRLEETELALERARAIAVWFAALEDWRTPSFLRNPESAAEAIRIRGIAVYDPNPLRDQPTLFP